MHLLKRERNEECFFFLFHYKQLKSLSATTQRRDVLIRFWRFEASSLVQSVNCEHVHTWLEDKGKMSKSGRDCHHDVVTFLSELDL